MKNNKGRSESDKIRRARKKLRYFERDLARAITEGRERIVKTRYEQAVTLLTACKLLGTFPKPNGSEALPFSIGGISAQDIARPIDSDKTADGKLSCEQLQDAERQ